MVLCIVVCCLFGKIKIFIAQFIVYDKDSIHKFTKDVQYRPLRLQTCCHAHKAHSCTAESAVSLSSGKNGPNDLHHRFSCQSTEICY